MMRTSILSWFVISATLVNCATAANPVLVDSGGGGQFTTVKAAIDSWCVGGSNAGETAPFVIRIKAGSGPYDESLTLDQTLVGQGNIVGALVIESDTSGTAVNIRLQKGPAGHDPALDDGLYIVQDQYDVSFKDIIFSRSILAPATQPMDELVRIDGFAAEAILNTFSFTNCVFTETRVDGTPMANNKTDALLPPPPQGGVVITPVAPFSRLFQISGDAGESWKVNIDNCVWYGSIVGNVFIRLSGTGLETLNIHNSLSSYSGADCINVGGNNPLSVINITGNDHKNGPLNCTASIQPSLAGSAFGNCFTIANGAPATVANTQVVNMSNFIAYATVSPSFASARGISGSHAKLNLSDGIISVPLYGTVDITRVPTVWERLTMHQNHSTGSSSYFGVVITGTTNPGEGSLLIRNSILSGLGNKIGGTLPVLGVTLENCGLPASGPDAITAVGGGASVVQTNVITSDPEYVAKDGLLPTFMDVNASAYAIASTTNGPLSGGADYVGTTNVDSWSLY